MKNTTTSERTSDREVIVIRTFNSRHASCGRPGRSRSCSAGGGSRSRSGRPRSRASSLSAQAASYRLSSSVRPPRAHGVLRSLPRGGAALASRLDNEESDNGQVTTVTLEEQGDNSLLVVRDIYASKEAPEESGASGGLGDTLDQLQTLLAAQGANVR